MIPNYCKQYRLSKGLRLIDVTKGEQVKTLSGFENSEGSANIQHLEKYIKLSIELNDYDNFTEGLRLIFNDRDNNH